MSSRATTSSTDPPVSTVGVDIFDPQDLWKYVEPLFNAHLPLPELTLQTNMGNKSVAKNLGLDMKRTNAFAFLQEVLDKKTMPSDWHRLSSLGILIIKCESRDVYKPLRKEIARFWESFPCMEKKKSNSKDDSIAKRVAQSKQCLCVFVSLLDITKYTQSDLQKHRKTQAKIFEKMQQDWGKQHVVHIETSPHTTYNHQPPHTTLGAIRRQAAGRASSPRRGEGRNSGRSIIRDVASDVRDVFKVPSKPVVTQDSQCADLVRAIKGKLAQCFERRCAVYELECDRLFSLSSLPLWNFFNFYLVKESFIFFLTAFHQREEAMRLYDELSALMERTHFENLTALRTSTSPAVVQEVEKLSPLLESSIDDARERISTLTLPELSFRRYVFSRQCFLLTALKRPHEVLLRCREFVRKLWTLGVNKHRAEEMLPWLLGVVLDAVAFTQNCLFLKYESVILNVVNSPIERKEMYRAEQHRLDGLKCDLCLFMLGELQRYMAQEKLPYCRLTLLYEAENFLAAASGDEPCEKFNEHEIKSMSSITDTFDCDLNNGVYDNAMEYAKRQDAMHRALISSRETDPDAAVLFLSYVEVMRKIAISAERMRLACHLSLLQGQVLFQLGQWQLAADIFASSVNFYLYSSGWPALAVPLQTGLTYLKEKHQIQPHEAKRKDIVRSESFPRSVSQVSTATDVSGGGEEDVPLVTVPVLSFQQTVVEQGQVVLLQCLIQPSLTASLSTSLMKCMLHVPEHTWRLRSDFNVGNMLPVMLTDSFSVVFELERVSNVVESMLLDDDHLDIKLTDAIVQPSLTVTMRIDDAEESMTWPIKLPADPAQVHAQVVVPATLNLGEYVDMVVSWRCKHLPEGCDAHAMFVAALEFNASQLCVRGQATSKFSFEYREVEEDYVKELSFALLPLRTGISPVPKVTLTPVTASGDELSVQVDYNRMQWNVQE